jgi:hypothetical protein
MLEVLRSNPSHDAGDHCDGAGGQTAFDLESVLDCKWQLSGASSLLDPRLASVPWPAPAEIRPKTPDSVVRIGGHIVWFFTT